ncbi:MAG: hypothetical protein ACT4PT_10455 [Methanobacteriota archaeon]
MSCRYESASGAREVKDAEPGCVFYESIFSPESGVSTVHVWFRDHEAAIAHITGVAPAKYLPKALEIADLLGLDVFGTPGPDLSKALAGFPVKSTTPRIAGFTRPPR